MHQLPQLPPHAAKAKGVVLADALLAAFDVRFKPQAEPQAAQSDADLPVSSPAAAAAQRSSTASAKGNGSSSSSQDGNGVGGASGQDSSTQDGGGQYNDGQYSGTQYSQVEDMLVRLQSLSWRRVDVCFKGAVIPFAHNNIQVTALVGTIVATVWPHHA